MKEKTIKVPDEIYKVLENLADTKKLSIDIIIAASIEYYNWLNEKNDNGYKIIASKRSDEKLLNIY